MEKVRTLEIELSPLSRLMTCNNRIYVCDLPGKYEPLKEKYKGVILPHHESHLAPLAYVPTPRCLYHYCLTRWPPRLEVCRFHHVCRRGRVHR